MFNLKLAVALAMRKNFHLFLHKFLLFAITFVVFIQLLKCSFYIVLSFTVQLL